MDKWIHALAYSMTMITYLLARAYAFVYSTYDWTLLKYFFLFSFFRLFKYLVEPRQQQQHNGHRIKYARARMTTEIGFRRQTNNAFAILGPMRKLMTL